MGRVHPLHQAGQRDSGQVMPLLAGVVAMVVITGLLLVGLGAQIGDRARASGIADAAALAGARNGEQAARDIAEENEATVIEFRSRGTEVEVTVEIGGSKASARARREW